MCVYIYIYIYIYWPLLHEKQHQALFLNAACSNSRVCLFHTSCNRIALSHLEHSSPMAAYAPNQHRFERRFMGPPPLFFKACEIGSVVEIFGVQIVFSSSSAFFILSSSLEDFFPPLPSLLLFFFFYLRIDRMRRNK